MTPTLLSFPPSKISRFSSVYLHPEEGFYEIHNAMRLPEPYLQTVVIDAEKEPYFVAYEIHTFERFISQIDPRYKSPRG